MTGFLHERELSRKSFLKGGGALIIGFSIAGAASGAKVAKAAGDDPFASNGPYDASQIDSWIAIHGDNTATVKLGKVELGQGSLTGLLMIAGEELDMSLDQLRWVNHDTNITPNQGPTVGSQSIQSGGKQVRAAAAAARATLLSLASKQLGVPVSSLSVSSGVVSGGGKTVTYGQLLGDKLFDAPVTVFSVRG
ncbi:MAG TPA: molybdopterin cofactor-binding domain-containing protein, partial [Myxococcaceae bacterium]